MNDNRLELSIQHAIKQTGFTLFLKQCIDDGLLVRAEDPILYAMGKRSARQVFINDILQDICEYALWLDHGGPYEENALYCKVQDNKLHYKYKFKKSDSECIIEDVSEQVIAEVPEHVIEGSIDLEELGLNSLSDGLRSRDVHPLLVPRLDVLLQKIAKSGNVTMKPVSVDVDWNMLTSLFDQISRALKEPIYFYQKLHYFKYVRSVSGQTPTAYVFAIPTAVIENCLKDHGVMLRNFWHPSRFWNGADSVWTGGSHRFKFSIVEQIETHFEFLTKFIWGLAALGFGIAAFLVGMQMAVAATVVCSGAAGLCGYSAYRLFTRQALHERADYWGAVQSRTGRDVSQDEESESEQMTLV